jgi:hypothetical protein
VVTACHALYTAVGKLEDALRTSATSSDGIAGCEIGGIEFGSRR